MNQLKSNYEKKLRKLISQLKNNKITEKKAIEELKKLPFTDLGFAKIDHHRSLRKGFPEVIFCEGKTENQVTEIIKNMQKNKENIIATRVSKELFKAIKRIAPKAAYYEISKLAFLEEHKVEPRRGYILIITAGTTDIPVAEEAALTAEFMGNRVERLFDVGVAGVHRLLAFQDKLFQAKVIIAVAGMEGALASLVAGIVPCPVIALPTSVGYGANFGGLSSLLTMLNSCAPGVGVVNIDNGFGAGYLASLINQEVSK